MKKEKIISEISKLINRHYGVLVLTVFHYQISIPLTMPSFVPNCVNVWIRKVFKIPKPKITFGMN